KIRIFGVGLGDNDGGNERISINGTPPVQLNRLPGHERDGGGRAYYVLVLAQPNDPDIRAVTFDQCVTVSFDHLIALEDKEPLPEQTLLPRLVLSLADGTEVTGYSDQSSLPVRVQNAKEQRAFNRIYSMQFQRKNSLATILLDSGEKLSCEPN